MWIITNNKTYEQVKFKTVDEWQLFCDMNNWRSLTIQFRKD